MHKLPVLKIYSIRDVTYRFSVLVVSERPCCVIASLTRCIVRIKLRIKSRDSQSDTEWQTILQNTSLVWGRGGESHIEPAFFVTLQYYEDVTVYIPKTWRSIIKLQSNKCAIYEGTKTRETKKWSFQRLFSVVKNLSIDQM